MIPLYFGTSDRQLFGAYHPGSGREKRGVVLCHPWGQEYLRAHQSFRFLASMISETGPHVLRFDWFGTGDSGGGCFEGGDPREWADDLSDAVDELKDMAELRTVSLVGLRLGTAPVAQVALARKDIDRVVFWDPVFDGGGYLANLLAQNHVQPLTMGPDGTPDSAPDDTVGVLGFPLTPSMKEGIESVSPSLIQAKLPPTLLLSTVTDPERYQPLESVLEAAGADWSFEALGGPEAWLEEGDFGTSGMPVAAIRRIAMWLE